MTIPDELHQLREQLDTLDTEIVNMVEKRMALVEEVIDVKRTHNIPLVDTQREKKMIETHASHVHHPVLKETVGSLVRTIIDISKIAQQIHIKKPFPFTRVGIIGLGIIGGSIAKAIKMRYPNTTIATIQRDSDDHKRAMDNAILDIEYESPTTLMNNVEIVVLASPIKTIIPIAQLYNDCAKDINHHVIVIDVASVKKPIADTFKSFHSEKISFIPTHPMAGSDEQGFDGAKGVMFLQRPWVICPPQDVCHDHVEKVAGFITALGSNVVTLTAEEHDQYSATASHLIRFVAILLFAYIHDVRQETMSIAGSGFEKTTRLVSSNPLMNAQIYEENQEYIKKELKAFIEYVQKHPIPETKTEEYFATYKSARDSFLRK